MSEQESRFSGIERELARQVSDKEETQILIEVVRQQLEIRGRNEIKRYEDQKELLTPEANLAVDQIIQPWFGELINSGIYDKLLEQVRNEDGIRSISLSEYILYRWPKRDLDQLQSEKPYGFSAESIVKYHRDNVREQVENPLGVDEVWEAVFHIGEYVGFGNNRHKNLYISRWPTLGAGFGFAMGAKRYHIYLDPENLARDFDQISPEVWIGFGRQIESGNAPKRLEDSLKPRNRSGEVGDGNTYRAIHAAKRAEYLRGKS